MVYVFIDEKNQIIIFCEYEHVLVLRNSVERFRKYFSGILIIPHATSCVGYNVFDPSVSQSVSPVFLVNSSEIAQQNFVKLCSYEGHNV